MKCIVGKKETKKTQENWKKWFLTYKRKYNLGYIAKMQSLGCGSVTECRTKYKKDKKPFQADFYAPFLTKIIIYASLPFKLFNILKKSPKHAELKILTPEQ